MKHELTEEQKQSILNEWNSRPDSPPSLLELIKIAFPNQNLDGRTKEGRSVKEFLSTRSIKARALEMALDGTEIPGYELKVRKGTRKVDDILAAFASLSPNTLQLEDFLPACKISITELERAIKDVAPKGSKQKFADAVIGDLVSAGVVRHGEEVPYLGKTK